MKHHSLIPNQDFLLDCDGVLLNWTESFRKYAQKVLKKVIDPAGPDDFNLTGWLGCSQEKYVELVQAFNGGEGGYFGNLPPLPGACEALNRAHAQGRKLTIITACSSDPKIIAQREQNLVNVFGNIFHEIHTVDIHASKRNLLAGFKDVIWVEDKIENALLGAELGHKSYIILSSHNKKHHPHVTHPLLVWADSWKTITQQENLDAPVTPCSPCKIS